MTSPKRKSKTGIGSTPRSRYLMYPDTRQGLGYGLSVPSGRFTPKSAQSSYPYRDADSFQDDDDEPSDSATDEFVSKLLRNYTGQDPLPIADLGSFVSGQTRMSEIASTGKGISPIPGMYKKQNPGFGGHTQRYAYTPGSMLRTGTKQGFAGTPPESKAAAADRHEVMISSLSDFLSDDELALLRAKLQVLNANGDI